MAPCVALAGMIPFFAAFFFTGDPPKVLPRCYTESNHEILDPSIKDLTPLKSKAAPKTPGVVDCHPKGGALASVAHPNLFASQ